MHMTPVTSTNVAAVGYDPARRILRVAFRSGRAYEYLGVGAQLYSLMLRPHPWRRIGRTVMAHPSRRVA